MKALALLCALVAIAAVPARADDVSLDLACKLHHTAIDVASFDALPTPVKDLLRPKLGEMAKRGEFFNATDVIERPGPSRRFIRAGHSGDKWFVWYEHGGIAYARNIIVVAWKPGDATARLITISGYSGNACAQTDLILDGRIPPQTAGWW